jgi:hypothetical protein
MVGDDAATDAASPEAATDAPTPLTWSQSAADVSTGEVVAIWGTSDTNIYVGTDLHAIYWVHDLRTTSTNLPSPVVGGGWASDPSHVYAVGASAWLAQQGVALCGRAVSLRRLDLDARSQRHLLRRMGKLVRRRLPRRVRGHRALGRRRGLHERELRGRPERLGLRTEGRLCSDVRSGCDHRALARGRQLGTGLRGCQRAAWAVWSSGPGDVYAVVSPGASGDPDAVVVHSAADGGWATEPVGQPGARLVAIWGSGPGDVYAAGYHVDSAGRTGDLYHSSGDGQWSRVALPGDIYDVTCVWGASPTNVYVGVYDVDDGPIVLQGRP